MHMYVASVCARIVNSVLNLQYAAAVADSSRSIVQARQS